MPMIINNNDQTGPNSQFGGLKAGFTIPGYQLCTESIVISPPATPKSRGIKILISKAGNSIRLASVGMNNYLIHLVNNHACQIWL